MHLITAPYSSQMLLSWMQQYSSRVAELVELHYTHIHKFNSIIVTYMFIVISYSCNLI